MSTSSQSFAALLAVLVPAIVLEARAGERDPPADRDPLELATSSASATATPAPTPTPTPAPTPTPTPTPLPENRAIVGAWSAAGLAPIFTVAHAGPYSFTYFGASLASISGHVWFLPPARRAGVTGRAGGRIAMAEAMPLGIYTSELSGAVGYRAPLVGEHHVAFLGGLQGSGGYAQKHQVAGIRAPELEVSWQWQHEGAFAEFAGLGGLAAISYYAIGDRLVATNAADRSYRASSHYAKPYAGARASFVVGPAFLTLVARRTFLGADRPAGNLDQAEGEFCFASGEHKDTPNPGGCFIAAFNRGEVAEVAPTAGPVVDAWSYRLMLNVMLAQVFLP